MGKNSKFVFRIKERDSCLPPRRREKTMHHQHQHGNYNNNNHAAANNTNSYSSWQSSYSLNALPLSPTVRAKLQFCGFNAVQDVLRHHSLPVQLVKSVPSLTLDEAQDVLKACRCGLDGFALRGAKSASGIVEERARANTTDDVLRSSGRDFRRGRTNRRDNGVLWRTWRREDTNRDAVSGVGATAERIFLRERRRVRLRGYRGEFYVRPVRGYGDWREEEIGRKSARNAMFGGGEERVRGVFREQYVFCGFDFKEDTRVQVSRGDGVVGVFGSHAEFVKEHPKVKLVVVDSIAFHFRQDFDDMALRASILAKTTNNLMSLAKKHELAVVTINQATTKPGGRLAPALGESYAHAATTRVALSWGEEGTRIAYVAKSPRLANRKAMYTITRDGVRDVVHAASKRKFT